MIQAKLRCGLAIGLACASLALGGAARAQVDTKPKGPIDITADQAEVVQSKCMAIWRGAAEAIQADTRLRADTITVYAQPKHATGANGQAACGGTDRIEADGHVYYVTPDRNARGDKGVYTAANDEIVLTGDVIVAQANNVARGDRLTINTVTHQATMSANASGAGKPGRVRGVFYPSKSDQNGAGAGSKPRTVAP